MSLLETIRILSAISLGAGFHSCMYDFSPFNITFVTINLIFLITSLFCSKL